MRRARWGDPEVLARRARRLFGLPNPIQWLRTRGVRIELVRAGDEGVPLPACAVCLSPWTDLAGTGESLIANNGRCAMFRPENIPDFARIYLGAVTPKHPDASPVYAELHGLPPLLFQVGDDELLLDDSRRVHDAVRRAGGRSTLETTAGVFHVGQMLDGFLPEARAALVRAAEFIEKTKGPG